MHSVRSFALRIAAATALVTAALAAQAGCPYERALTVAPSWRMGPALPCDTGIQVDLPGVRINPQGVACPLFVIITPTHEIAEPSDRRTRTVEVRLDPERTAFFQCTPHWFLFFSRASTCDVDQIVVTGNVQRLVTEACAPVETTSN